MTETLKKTLIIFLCLFGLLSCTSSSPYEVKSPCVSGDSENPWYRSPCSKRPANSSWELT